MGGGLEGLGNAGGSHGGEVREWRGALGWRGGRSHGVSRCAPHPCGRAWQMVTSVLCSSGPFLNKKEQRRKTSSLQARTRCSAWLPHLGLTLVAETGGLPSLRFD